MPEAEIQYVSDEKGRADCRDCSDLLRRDIESGRDTAHLLKSEAMKRRLLEAKERRRGLPSRKPLRDFEFDAAAFENLAWWVARDRAALRIIRLNPRSNGRP